LEGAQATDSPDGALAWGMPLARGSDAERLTSPPHGQVEGDVSIAPETRSAAWPGAEAALGEAGHWERAFLLGAEWFRAHHVLPPEGVRALLPTKAVQCLEWLMARAPDSTESWLAHAGALDWLAELAEGGAWRMFLRYYLQLYFHAPPPRGPPVGSVPYFLKTLPYAFFVAPRGDWMEVPPDGDRWPAISTSR
jgi:hypothetical protein